MRDRDAVYGTHFRRRVAGFQVTEVLIAPRAPWQNPYVERLIGSVRREYLDHVIVLGEVIELPEVGGLPSKNRSPIPRTICQTGFTTRTGGVTPLRHRG
ncbi:MAG: integrase core domain-containing protein [Thermoanaerobaculia bacterium]